MRRGSTPPRTSQPTTPDGEANLRAVTEGSMETLKNETAGHESRLDRSSLRGKGPKLIGTALYGAVRRVVWDPGANYSRGPDSVLC